MFIILPTREKSSKSTIIFFRQRYGKTSNITEDIFFPSSVFGILIEQSYFHLKKLPTGTTKDRSILVSMPYFVVIEQIYELSYLSSRRNLCLWFCSAGPSS